MTFSEEPGAARARFLRVSQKLAMAPMPLPLSCLLKYTECLQRARGVCNVFRALPHGASRFRPWRRNFRAISRGVGPPLSQQHPVAPKCAASVCSSPPSGEGVAERLWSVYNETKRQTQGMRSHTRSHLLELHAISNVRG